MECDDLPSDIEELGSSSDSSKKHGSVYHSHLYYKEEKGVYEKVFKDIFIIIVKVIH